jgi:serine/threonine-protein kinase
MEGLRESVAERYDLLDVLGRGGMGVVYRARDRVLARTVAVKVLPRDLAGDPALVARFEREARAAGALNHPNIVGVYDTGREAATHFIVMEYVDGRSLAEIVRDRGPLAPHEATQIAVQIADALAAAHRAGIIHRDIKPANVMVDSSRRVKVLDFGIARVAQATSLTQPAVVLGSVPYLAPELTHGRPGTERSDIYALGCVLHELLTGHPPFVGDHPAAVMHQHNTAEPRHPADLNPLVPAPLDALVMQMLAKRPEDRPASAQELAAALTSLDAGRARQPAAAEVPTEPTQPLPRARDPRRARWMAAAGLAVLGLAALLVALLASPSGQPRHRATGAQRPAATHPAPTPARTAPTSPSSTHKPAPASPSRPTTLTVSAAAGALTTLITQDLQSGAIDQHGQDLLNHLQDVLTSYDQGNVSDALHKVDDLVKHVGDLADHGDISPSALPAITTAISRLRGALLRSAPSVTNAPGGPANDGHGSSDEPPPKPHDHPGKHH